MNDSEILSLASYLYDQVDNALEKLVSIRECTYTTEEMVERTGFRMDTLESIEAGDKVTLYQFRMYALALETAFKIEIVEDFNG